MAWDAITDTEIQPGKPGSETLFQKIKGNLEYLYGLLAASSAGVGVSNGSFEIDSDVDGVPDGWTVNLYPGGSSGFEATSPIHGSKGYKFVHPGGAGNGGGYITSDYFEVTQYVRHIVGFLHYATAAGMKNAVEVLYYNKDKTYLSTVSVYNSTGNPTSPMRFVFAATPPANARFAKIRCTGGNSDTNVAGTAYFDGIYYMEPAFSANLLYAQAGDTIICGNDTEKALFNTGGGYSKIKAISIGRYGTLRIKFTATIGGGGTGSARVYRNGVAVGTAQTLTASPTPFTEDIAGWAPGDECAVYANASIGEGQYGTLSNFRICIDSVINENITLE